MSHCSHDRDFPIIIFIVNNEYIDINYINALFPLSSEVRYFDHFCYKIDPLNRTLFDPCWVQAYRKMEELGRSYNRHTMKPIYGESAKSKPKVFSS